MSDKDNNPSGGEGETVEQVKAKLAETEQKLASATGELSEDRAKRQTIEGERDALKVKLADAEARAAAAAGGDPAKAGEAAALRVLEQREQEGVKANQSSAEEFFKSRYKEFSSDNDQGGLKFAAVMARYKGFNTDGKKSVEDFVKLLEDAYTLVNPTRSVPQPTTYAPFASTTSDPGSGQRTAAESKLSPREREIVTRLGCTEERFLKQKEKRPQYIASLLRNAE